MIITQLQNDDHLPSVMAAFLLDGIDSLIPVKGKSGNWKDFIDTDATVAPAHRSNSLSILFLDVLQHNREGKLAQTATKGVEEAIVLIESQTVSTL